MYWCRWTGEERVVPPGAFWDGNLRSDPAHWIRVSGARLEWLGTGRWGHVYRRVASSGRRASQAIRA